MIFMELNKVQKIIDLFDFDKEFKFWNIKTKITSIVDRFYDKYLKLPSNERTNYIEVFRKDKKYQMLCGKKIVNPAAKNEEYVSKSAMRQYLDVLSSFKIIEKMEKYGEFYEIIYEKLLNGEQDVNSSDIFLRIDENFKKITNSQTKKYFTAV
ncbi:hypothetical protein SCLARK_001347 [Spiroplasma clarkii]|nr:hypothetical protein SCLARK_001347 [Spiroplasma clarkii]